MCSSVGYKTYRITEYRRCCVAVACWIFRYRLFVFLIYTRKDIDVDGKDADGKDVKGRIFLGVSGVGEVGCPSRSVFGGEE